MKTKILFTGTICSMLLFAITGNTQACYYDGDPVLISSSYDTPVTDRDNDCYYGGDPVALKAGGYNSPIILVEGSGYYIAEMQEAVSDTDISQDSSEFSAFEHETETPASSRTVVERELKSTVNDDSEYQWVPESWTYSY